MAFRWHLVVARVRTADEYCTQRLRRRDSDIGELHQILPIVLRIHLHQCTVWIGFQEFIEHPHGFVWVPFEFVAGQLAIAFLNVVDLFLVVGAPEEAIGPLTIVLGVLQPFDDAEVLPQRAQISA